MIKRFVLAASLALIGSMIVACSVSDRTIANAEKRINSLKAKGVPDSALSPCLVHLYQAREAKRRGQSGESRAGAKMLRIELAKAETLYREHIANLKPAVDSLMAVIGAARKSYDGMERKKLDSLLVEVDSFIRIKWYLQAHTKSQELVARIPQFNFDSERAKEIRDRVPGEWVCTNKTTSKENKDINAVEKKIFIFEKNGSAKLIENKKGQSGPYLREDWQFDSWGKWDVNGDTVHMFVNRFAAVRQNFQRMYLEDGGKKKSWRNEPQPTYDSLITDGSQNRFITFSDLQADFEQTRKF
ncbi:MAG: hypothetical protein JXA71_04490 [Chitinispirillaceae bacterium]|nr:hypothetical protein [Chitinispirillaceae bacterium]